MIHFIKIFCTKYTTEDGTDMTLADRKKYIYEAIMSEVNCQENCEFSSYNPENRNLNCKCKIEENINTVDYKKFSIKKLYNTFYDVLKYSNYKVIMCYKLVFDKNIFSYNKGFWILFILFILYLTQLMIYLYKKISPLKLNIAKLYFKRMKPDDKENNVLENNSPNNNECITEKIPISSNILFPPLKRNKKALIVTSKRAYEGRNSDKNALKSKSKENLNKTDFKNSEKKESKFAPFNNNKNNNKNIPLPNTEEKGNIYLKQGELDNFELNHLEYEEALILDK